VEDDEGNRDALAEACSEVGVKVFLARDGDEALALLETIPRPCLVVVDVLMPRLGGRELIARLADRDDAAEIPVLVVTATREAGLDSLPGVIGVLQKPFDL
jgi:CheY-like chemotaxis protein